MTSKRMAAATAPTLSSSLKTTRARAHSALCLGSAHAAPRSSAGGRAPSKARGGKKRKALSKKKAGAKAKAKPKAKAKACQLSCESPPASAAGAAARSRASTRAPSRLLAGLTGIGRARGAMERAELEAVIAALEDDYNAEQARYVAAVEAAGDAPAGSAALDHGVLRDASEQLSLKSWQLSTLRALIL